MTAMDMISVSVGWTIFFNLSPHRFTTRMYIICTYAKESVCLLCYDDKNATHNDDNLPGFKDNSKLIHHQIYDILPSLVKSSLTSEVLMSHTGFGRGVNDT